MVQQCLVDQVSQDHLVGQVDQMGLVALKALVVLVVHKDLDLQMDLVGLEVLEDPVDLVDQMVQVYLGVQGNLEALEVLEGLVVQVDPGVLVDPVGQVDLENLEDLGNLEVKS